MGKTPETIWETMRMQSEKSRRVLRTKWVDGVQGPLEEAAGNYENAYLYQSLRTSGEARQLLGSIALKLRINEVPSIEKGEE